jgi:DNA mismatch repair protein MutS2
LVSPQPALTEIDVRGLSVEEALFEVDSAVRSALATGVATLCVIHGMGTGVLKRELSVWLRRHARVESFRRGGPGEGSDGVTVVTLKP